MTNPTEFSALSAHAFEKRVLKVGTQDCDIAKFKMAQTNFANKIGIPGDEGWYNPLVMYKAIQAVYGHDNKMGLVNVCNAFSGMLDELNTVDNIDVKKCFNPIWLLGNDDTPDDAIHFMGIVGLLRFQCGAGFYRMSLQ